MSHARSSSYSSLPSETSHSTQVRTSTPLCCAPTNQVHTPVSPIAVPSQNSIQTTSKASFKESSVERERVQALKDVRCVDATTFTDGFHIHFSADDSTLSSADAPLPTSLQPKMSSFGSDASVFMRNAQRSFQNVNLRTKSHF